MLVKGIVWGIGERANGSLESFSNFAEVDKPDVLVAALHSRKIGLAYANHLSKGALGKPSSLTNSSDVASQLTLALLYIHAVERIGR